MILFSVFRVSFICFIQMEPSLFFFTVLLHSLFTLITMGKDQYKKKTQAERRRHNPIRVPDSHIPHGTLNLKGKEKEEAMLPILKKASSETVGYDSC